MTMPAPFAFVLARRAVRPLAGAPPRSRSHDAEATLQRRPHPPAGGPRRRWPSRSSRRRSSRTPRTRTSTRAWASPTRSSGKYDEAVAAPSARRSSSTPTTSTCATTSAPRSCSPASAQEGKAEFLAAFNDPTNPTPEISVAQPRPGLLRGEELRGGRQLVPHAASSRNKALPRRLPGPGRRAASPWASADGGDRARWRRASRRCPDHLALLLALGEAYYRAGRFTDARAAARGGAHARIPRGAAGRRAGELLKHFPQVGGARRSLAMPYQRILDELVRSVPAREGALLLDATARSWSQAGSRDYRHRLIGAYQGIALATARRIGRPLRHGRGRLPAVPVRRGQRHPAPAEGRLLPGARAGCPAATWRAAVRPCPARRPGAAERRSL